MKAKEDKCHLIVSTNELAEIQIGVPVKSC